MSVQTQIDRISDAVSAAKAALTEKGVTVPDGTKVDGLAALIAAIESGGGSGGETDSRRIVKMGTYTANYNAAANSSYILSGAEVKEKGVPEIVISWLNTQSSMTSSGSTFRASIITFDAVDGRNYTYNSLLYGHSTTSFSNYYPEVSKRTIAVPTSNGFPIGATGTLKSGESYTWIAIWGATV